MSIEYVQEEMQKTEYSDGVVTSDPEVDVAPEVLEETEEERDLTEDEALEAFIESSYDYSMACEGLDRLMAIESKTIELCDKLEARLESGVESFDEFEFELLHMELNHTLGDLGDVTQAVFPALENLDEYINDAEFVTEGVKDAVKSVSTAVVSSVKKIGTKFANFLSSSETMAKKNMARAKSLKESLKSYGGEPSASTMKVAGAHNLQWKGKVDAKSIVEGLKATEKAADILLVEYPKVVNKFIGKMAIELRNITKKFGHGQFELDAKAMEMAKEFDETREAKLAHVLKGMKNVPYIGDKEFRVEVGHIRGKSIGKQKGMKSSTYTVESDVPTLKQLGEICDGVIRVNSILIDRLNKSKTILTDTAQIAMSAAEEVDKAVPPDNTGAARKALNLMIRGTFRAVPLVAYGLAALAAPTLSGAALMVFSGVAFSNALSTKNLADANLTLFFRAYGQDMTKFANQTVVSTKAAITFAEKARAKYATKG